MRRLRIERELTQQALAVQLGISASYLNLIEHDQRAVTASLLIKAAETLKVDRATLSGTAERQIETQLREAFSDKLPASDPVPEAEIALLASTTPNAARAVLALYRAFRMARDHSGGISLPSGRRVLLPTEEVRDFFNAHANHFLRLENAADALTTELAVAPSETNHAIAQRLRRRHRILITIGPLPSTLRRYDPETRRLCCPKCCRARAAASISPSNWRCSKRVTPSTRWWRFPCPAHPRPSN